MHRSPHRSAPATQWARVGTGRVQGEGGLWWRSVGCSSPWEHLDQDPLRLRGWAALSSSLVPSYILLLHPKESQAPLWFQKATCSDWSLISPLAPPAGQERQPASVHLQTPGRGCWASAVRASLAAPLFQERNLPFPLQIGSPFDLPRTFHTALETP